MLDGRFSLKSFSQPCGDSNNCGLRRPKNCVARGRCNFRDLSPPVAGSRAGRVQGQEAGVLVLLVLEEVRVRAAEEQAAQEWAALVSARPRAESQTESFYER
jgi:hypothetical protein